MQLQNYLPLNIFDVASFKISLCGAGPALAWVPWVPGNPQIFQQVYKEPMDFEEGKLSLSGEANIRNPRIEISNVGPAKEIFEMLGIYTCNISDTINYSKSKT